ncbi:TraB/GumN family protein [Sphingomonas sp. HF-S3]|uniref:TraB/GumN family protein n=1 Tax=Sphingomonas rustica TaxID=3103142 RepID=A0ABV0B910_9SPHN
MLKKLLVSGAALAFAFAGAPALAQQAAPAAPAAAVATRDADPALWVVKDDDTTIYLFGTVHVLKPGLSWFDEAVKTAFDKSDTLVLEMIEPDPATMQALMMKMVINLDGPNLSAQLPEEKRAAFAAAMSEAGTPAAGYERFDPWFASLVITLTKVAKLGYDPNQGAEKTLTAAAKAAEKPIVGLETAEEQLGFFDKLPQAVQVKYLEVTLDQLPKTGEMLDKMVESWAKGDPDTLAAVMNEGMAETPEVNKAILVDRNVRWADWIAERMKKPGTVFIAVGAGHLAGPDSVQTYLAARKLKTERVKY